MPRRPRSRNPLPRAPRSRRLPSGAAATAANGHPSSDPPDPDPARLQESRTLSRGDAMKLKGVNPIEQHVEKIVLVTVSGVFLLVVAAQFLYEPNKVKVGSAAPVPPGKA